MAAILDAILIFSKCSRVTKVQPADCEIVSRWLPIIHQENLNKQFLRSVKIYHLSIGLRQKLYISVPCDENSTDHDDIRRVADSNRRRLRSSSSALLTARPTRLRRLMTMSDRAFPVAGSRLWNSLPHEVTSASTLPVFCSRLQTYLFQLSFPTN